jgi:predicted nucleic acid-binding protein
MVTIDTNIAFYSLVRDGAPNHAKVDRAKVVLAEADFLSVQVLNEYAFVAKRKLRRDWAEIVHDVELLRHTVGKIRSVDDAANREALRIAERYQLAFFDALLLAVALANGATVFYSEDMQHGLVIDGRLTITDPFLHAEPA